MPVFAANASGIPYTCELRNAGGILHVGAILPPKDLSTDGDGGALEVATRNFDCGDETAGIEAAVGCGDGILVAIAPLGDLAESEGINKPKPLGIWATNGVERLGDVACPLPLCADSGLPLLLSGLS